MRRRLGSRARFLAVLGGILGIHLLVGAAAVVSLRTQVSTERLVTHTHEVRTDIQDARALLLMAETAERGFIITGDTTSVGRMKRAETAVENRLVVLVALTADNAEQQARLAALRPIVVRRLARLDTAAAVRLRQGAAASIARVVSGGGQALMDSIHAEFDAMDRAEVALLAPRTLRAESGAARATAIVIAGAFLALLVAVFGATFIARAAAARAASEQRYASVIEVMAEGVVVQDAAGRVIDCNQAAERILGLPRAAVLRLHEPSAPWPAFYEDRTPFPKEQHPALVALRTGTSTSNVVMGIRRPDRATRWLLVNAKVLTGEDGAVAGVVSSFSDITRRRGAEEALATARDAAEHANRAKSEFLTNMSHELRTPLNSVIGFAAILLTNRTGVLREEELDFLQRIHNNGRHLLDLINSVLDLSKIEAGHQNLEIAPVPLGNLVADVLAQFRPQIEQREVVLRAAVPSPLEPLATDAVKLKQVLINLVGNALKFTEQGEVTVRVVADPETRRPARLEVTDTGIGIPRDRQAAVFEAFQQAGNTTARRFGGTGLGLTITRSLLERMGYAIRVASDVGRGTTFTVDFAPARAASPAVSGR